MRIAAVLGSPHGMRGNTGRLLESFVQGAKSRGADVTLLSLADLPIQPCRACDTCHRIGRCPNHDQFNTIQQAMRDSEGIVLASPNYIFSVSAQMKCLLDRCCGPLHLQVMDGKYGAALVTSGGSGSEEVEAYMLRFLRAMGCWTVGSVGIEAWKLAGPATAEPVLEAATDLGIRLCEAIEGKVTYDDQAAERRAFYTRMKELMTLRKDEWPFEYDYWQSMGRL
jgi:multimeric flavodoxin WrbA